MHRETRAARSTSPKPGQPMNVPLYQSSTFVFDDPTGVGEAMTRPDGGFAYSGFTNPTNRALEKTMADLEGGTNALVTASGSSAINSVFQATLTRGDHVIAQKALYGGTVTILRDLTEHWGLEVSYIDGVDPAELRAAVRPNTKLVYLETISNPIAHVSDLPALAAEARRHGLLTAVDSTFATPLLCRPIEHGVDIVIHSSSKYLGGHHDVVGGVVVFADQELYLRTWRQAGKLGVVADPFAAWLVLRGLKTLPLRLNRQCANATFLAEQVSTHPAVTAVHYPGLPTHPSHARATKLLDGYGATVAVETADALGFMRDLKLILNAASLGGTETTVMHPATTSHRGLSPDAMRQAGVSQGMVRIACGIEHPDDLWEDIRQALDQDRTLRQAGLST